MPGGEVIRGKAHFRSETQIRPLTHLHDPHALYGASRSHDRCTRLWKGYYNDIFTTHHHHLSPAKQLNLSALTTMTDNDGPEEAFPAAATMACKHEASAIDYQYFPTLSTASGMISTALAH